MAAYGLLIDYEYCTGCQSCEVACKEEHGIPVGQWGIHLLDDENYRLYKQGGECTAFQGRLHASPYRFPLPREDRWHVIIEPNTYSGIAEFTVRVLDDAVIAAGAQAPSEQAEAVQHS